jgi:hypothetical protein
MTRCSCLRIAASRSSWQVRCSVATAWWQQCYADVAAGSTPLLPLRRARHPNPLSRHTLCLHPHAEDGLLKPAQDALFEVRTARGAVQEALTPDASQQLVQLAVSHH